MLFVLGIAFAIALAAVMWSLLREQRSVGTRRDPAVARRSHPSSLRRNRPSSPSTRRRGVAPDDDQDFLDELSRRARRDDGQA